MNRPSPEGLLLALDFDNTQFQTSKKIPGVINVPVAFESTVKDMFGPGGLAVYLKRGGLRNRAPGEVVKDLILDPALRISRYEVLDLANSFIYGNLHELEGYVPPGKGFTIDLNKPLSLDAISEAFVRQKQSYMAHQIGMRLPTGEVWPPTCRNFDQFWATVNGLKEDGVNITTATVSSGHELFIQETYNAHDLPQPDIIVSEDDTRGNRELNGRNVAKPSLFPLALAVRRWLNIPGMPGLDLDFELIRKHAANIVYFGDDSEKDGQMAEAGNILFGHYLDKPVRPTGLKVFSFNDWNIPGKVLLQKTGKFEAIA